MSYYQNETYAPASFEQKVSTVMRGVYVRMFFGLLLTAAVAWFVFATAAPGSGLFHFIVTNRWAYWGIAILELGMVLGITGAINKMSSSVATLLFFAFAIVNGLTFSLIFAAYSLGAIFKTFLITAGTFGAMSIYGYFTARDLSRIGSLLYMALFGLLICLVVNIFWANSTFEWIISFLGVAIFIGLTAWDTQQIRRLAEMDPNATDGRIATLGALTLYLDFINLFLYLLRFFGNRD